MLIANKRRSIRTFLIFSLSVFRNPLSISKIVTITDIARAITIIALIPAPTQIIIIGPKATLGKLFNTTKKGSDTLDAKGNHHKMIEINKKVPKENEKG